MRYPTGRALVVFAFGASLACGSSSKPSPGQDDEQDAASSGDGLDAARAENDGASGSPSEGGADATSSSTRGDAGGADATSPVTSEGGARFDGGSVWQPTTAAPIHFHWWIGASDTFASSDLVTGQSGQVVYDIDGANATAADVAAIHAAGAIAVCYVDVGTLESNRPDTAQFPSSVIGPAVAGWPENWLLVTAANQSILLPLMKARFTNWCQAKGFDAIEPDNLDAWNNMVDVTETDNLAYDLAIADLAHALPLSIGLKNLMTDLSSSQYPQFLAAFDWALNEQCYEYGECGAYSATGSFLPAGKAVFDVEYSTAPTCSQANTAHMNAQKTDLDLVGPHESGYVYTPCIPDSQDTW